MNENFLKALIKKEDGTIIKIEVVPNSSKTEFSEYNEWRECFSVKIKEQPQKGKSNKELIEYFSSIFLTNEILIISGHKSRQKSIYIKKDKNEILKILENILK